MIVWTVDGGTLSIGVQKKDIDSRLFRQYLYRKWSDHDPSLTGAVGTTIQFTNQWAPNAVLGGITDVPNLPLRNAAYAVRTIQLLTYGEGREWTREVVLRSQAKVEKAIREELPDSVARSINAACAAQMLLANCIYTPTGALGAETVALNYAGVVPGGAYARHMSEWDLSELQTVGALLGMKPHPTYGWVLMTEPINRGALYRRIAAFGIAGPPKSLELALEAWNPGQFVAWLHGVSIFFDNSLDVLSSARVGTGLAPTPFGDALFWGANPLVEAGVNGGMQTGTEVHDAGRKLRLYMYEEAIGWTLHVNTAGVGAVPPATVGSQCCIRITGT